MISATRIFCEHSCCQPAPAKFGHRYLRIFGGHEYTPGVELLRHYLDVALFERISE